MTRICALFPLFSVALVAADLQPSGKFEVHEWGTFTSIAGPTGFAERWQPFGGPTDLPCFVHRMQIGKGDLSGTVRMETPVIYFYSPAPMTANVRVGFPNGYITEWYPEAERKARTVENPYVRPPTHPQNASIAWPSVKVNPSHTPSYPFEFESSHYYAARSTDAAPVIAGKEQEKFLFYRGVGDFQPPLAVTIAESGALSLKNLGEVPIPQAILFENRGGAIRYHILGSIADEITAIRPEEGDLATLMARLERTLSSEGLFDKEAHAMVDTWRDSWFEEGARVFYIVPSIAIDSILPLAIDPRPDRIARVFVGRIEVFTPEIKKAVRDAAAKDDRMTLEKYGRFLQPLLEGSGLSTHTLSALMTKYLTALNACGASSW